MAAATQFYIGGAWVQPQGASRRAVIDPATEQPIAEVALASVEDVNRAVNAARAAFPAYAATSRAQRLALLQKMYKQWPFFKTLLSNLDMVMAKSDLAIAARYVELVEDKKLGKRIFGLIRTEWQATSDALTMITGDKHRLASNPSLARSIEHRFPYLDPLNHLQVELMRRYRHRKEADPENARVQTGIQISINGIAAGLRNTG